MTDSPRALVAHTTLESFFYEQIGTAQERAGTELPEEIEAYVVYLLADYARRTGVAGRRSKALALEFLAALAGPRSSLRELGDRALFIAGVVPRSVDRSAVNVDYVRSIGASAYRQLGECSRGLEVFTGLADRFVEVSEVIGDTVEARDERRPEDLMAIYERWRRHGHSRDAKRLAAAGVLLDPRGADIVQ